MDVGCGIVDLKWMWDVGSWSSPGSKRLGHGPADYVKRKETCRRATERCTMVLKNRGGLEGMVALSELNGGIRGSRFSLFFVFFPLILNNLCFCYNLHNSSENIFKSQYP